MSAKLIMTKGLPGSGKSYWAKEQVKQGNGQIIRLNKDSLRDMLHGDLFSHQREGFTLAIRDLAVREALLRSLTVIVDDTNLAPKHESTLRGLAARGGADFEVKDFTCVPVQVCLERDADRAVGRVGRKVILDMYEKYLYKKPVPPAHIPGAPSAIICDLDGTVAEMVDRGPFDANVENDRPREHVLNVVRGMLAVANHTRVLFVSGRKEEARVATETWLRRQGFSLWWTLFMRTNDDNRRDSIVKREIYDREIAGKYNVIAVFDDRPQVIRECWRPLGLPVFDVGDGREF